MKKEIDLSSYKRRAHFENFMKMENPFATIVVQVDITNWFNRVKEKQPFFLSFQYLLGQAANRVPELRRRIIDEKIYEFDYCGCSYIVLRDDETYRYCNVSTSLSFEDYLKEAKKNQEVSLSDENLTEYDDPISYFYISCVPFLNFSGLCLPYANNRFSNPCFTIGKYYMDGDRVKMPVAITVHHGLVDGVHIGKFYEYLQEMLDV